MDARPTSRTERQAETRERLLHAAMEVFSTKGFHRASIDAIARQAGFTKGAVYANFASKDDLFLAVVDWRTEVAFGDQPGPSGDQPESSNPLSSPELFEMNWATLSLEVILYAVRESPELHRELAQRYQQIDRRAAAELRRAGGVASEAAPTTALVRSALHEGLMLRRLIDPDHISADHAEHVHRTYFDAALTGLDRPDGGRGEG